MVGYNKLSLFQLNIKGSIFSLRWKEGLRNTAICHRGPLQLVIMMVWRPFSLISAWILSKLFCRRRMSFKLNKSRNRLQHKCSFILFFLFAVSFQELWHGRRRTHFQGWVWSHQEQLPLPQQVWRAGQEPVSTYILTPCVAQEELTCLHSLCLFPRDGKISREEMIDYFMKASSLLNCKMGFIHTFTETTYVKPTFCEHCAGFVSQNLRIFCCFI